MRIDRRQARGCSLDVAGTATSSRSDVEALGLTPLALHDMGEWDPADEYWGEDGEPLEEWEQAIIAHGKRRRFEMEQVIPGADPEDFDSDPIIEASERNDAGDHAGGELSLRPTFRDALPWGLIDNRPYLRCLHGKGLALWRIGGMRDAAAIFQRLLWLNPSDNRGARFCLAAVDAGKAWEP